MSTQLRRYQFAEGTLAEWLPHWHENVVPLRQRYGFRVLFAYADHDNSQFVWALEYGGTPEELQAREREYYDSPEWAERTVGKNSDIHKTTVSVVAREYPKP